MRRHERLRRGAIRRNVRRVGAAPGAGQAHDGAPGWPGQYPGETDWLAASSGQIALATDTEHNGRALAFDGDSCRIGARDRRLPRRHSRRAHRPVLSLTHWITARCADFVLGYSALDAEFAALDPDTRAADLRAWDVEYKSLPPERYPNICAVSHALPRLDDPGNLRFAVELMVSAVAHKAANRLP